eukprot:6532380-Alexandrium_andersonii.AAC.1
MQPQPPDSVGRCYIVRDSQTQCQTQQRSQTQPQPVRRSNTERPDGVTLSETARHSRSSLHLSRDALATSQEIE